MGIHVCAYSVKPHAPLSDSEPICATAHWKWPRGLLATSTHDSKRSEDVRARIGVLSEVPQAWARVVRGWFERHRKHWGAEPPDTNIQYLLYQTLVGAWPIEKERVKAYVEKAAREAKSRTTWTEPNAPGFAIPQLATCVA